MDPVGVSTPHPARGVEAYRQAVVALLSATDDVAEAEARQVLADLLHRDGVEVALAVAKTPIAIVTTEAGL